MARYCAPTRQAEETGHVTPEQGDLLLLDTPTAHELLNSAIPARLAYVWTDGTPRVIPIWFQWTGREIVVCSPETAPKMKAFGPGQKVAVTIDTEEWPAKALSIRGTARTEVVEGEVPEYAEMTRRYLGEEGSLVWRQQYAQMFARVVRIAITPEWVALIDIPNGRFPSAIDAVMAGAM